MMQGDLFPPESDWKPPAELPGFSGARRIGLDVETKDPQLRDLGPGSMREGSHIVGVSLHVPGWGSAYYPVRHEAPGAKVSNLFPRQIFGWLAEEFGKFTGEIVGANLQYDIDFLMSEGIDFTPDTQFLDVQVAEPLLDEYRFTYRLEVLGQEYVGAGKDEELLKQAANVLGIPQKDIKSNLWRMPPEYVGPYAEEDAALPLKIMELQILDLEKQGLMEVFRCESDLIPELVRMRRRGVRIDVEKAEQVGAHVRGLRDNWKAEIKRLSGKHLDLWAAESLGPALEERGFQLPRTGKTGQYSIKKDWLEAHTDADELVKAIQNARRYDKVDNTFIQGHVLGHQVNGRIHCTFNQLRSDDSGTISGRFSSTQPNLQQISARDEELAPMIRGLFLPEEGEVWEALDWSQIEFRFLVHFAAQIARSHQFTGPAVRSALAARERYASDPDADFHKMCAEFGGMDPEDKFVRKRVKNVNFGKVYGAGAPKIALTMGVSENEARDFIQTYERELPFVPETYQVAQDRARRRGFIRTTLGRKARFPFWEPKRGEGTPQLWEKAVETYGERGVRRAYVYRALNRLLQGSAADLMKEAMRQYARSDAYKVLGPALLTVHDELALSRPATKEGEEAIQEVQRIMNTCLNLEVPIASDRESGPNWGEVK